MRRPVSDADPARDAAGTLGDGLVYEDLMPLVWTPGPVPEEPALARMNADNQQLLAAEAALDDVKISDSLKEESPALLAELQRIDYKLNILLRLIADLAVRQAALPAARLVRLSSTGAAWDGDDGSSPGSGVLLLYVNPALPQPLKLAAHRAADTLESPGRARLQFTGLSDPVVDLIEKFIFRHHRRLVAGGRLPPPRPA